MAERQGPPEDAEKSPDAPVIYALTSFPSPLLLVLQRWREIKSQK